MFQIWLEKLHHLDLIVCYKYTKNCEQDHMKAAKTCKCHARTNRYKHPHNICFFEIENLFFLEFHA